MSRLPIKATTALFIITLLTILPSCRKKNSTKSPEAHQSNQKAQTVTSHGIYDEDIEAFVLEESTDPLGGAHHTIDGVSFVVDPEDATPSNAALYGLKTIYFDFDKHSVRKDQKPTVDYDIKKIKELTHKGHVIVVEGHACNSAGSAQYNIQLSAKRARVIYDRLIVAGISKDKLRFVGRGFEMCTVSHGNRQQQAPNRRVEFFVQQSKE